MAVATDIVERIWDRDPTVWTGKDEAQWLGWLDEPQRMSEQLDDVTRVLEEEGVQKFSDSFAELLAGIKAKRGELVSA